MEVRIDTLTPEERQQKQAEAYSKKVKAYQDVFNSPQGQEVLQDILSHCHFYQPSHTPGDPYETAFREGERNVALKIVKALNTDPKKVVSETLKRMEEARNALV